MTQNRERNRQILLQSRPQGRPVPENFSLHIGDIPQPGEGEVLLRTVYLSLDPYMRGRMSDQESYAEPVALGAVMTGGCVCQVEKSNNAAFSPGEWVVSYCGWQDYSISNGEGLLKLGEMEKPSYALGVLGMPGFTAFMGLLDIGQPKEGETVVVAAATGAVGSTVGQIAKIKGARAVGIAGSMEKCNHAVKVLGFDACINRNDPKFEEKLQQACPCGIDVYYENVGGAVLDAVLPLLNTNARIPLCGLISQYNSTKLPEGPDHLPLLMGTLLRKRVLVKGFIIFDDYADRFPEFLDQMSAWCAEGRIHYREQLINGLESAPQGLIDLLDGKNFGKVVIQVGRHQM